jgi:uncharacterized cupredoxin-like copper-binding protein
MRFSPRRSQTSPFCGKATGGRLRCPDAVWRSIDQMPPVVIWINAQRVETRDGVAGAMLSLLQRMIVMKITRRASLLIACGFSAAVWATASLAAETTIHVSLWDKGPDSVMMDDAHMFGMGAGMMKDMSMAMMGIKLDVQEVAAGKVTFEVSNDSKDIIHEMVVTAIASRDTEMPYLKDENKIDEDAAGHLGEVAELDPEKSGSLSIDMKPGLYLLYCNVPGHYIGGMWTVLTVKG